MLRASAVTLSACLLAAACAPAALATSPGRNGRIAYADVPAHHRYAGSAIFSSWPNGRSPAQLTGVGARGPTGADQPVFSPNGSHIAFLSGSALAVMRADGSGQRRVISLAPRRGLSLNGPASWSADGRTLALTGTTFDPADPETNLTGTFIYTVRIDGTHLRRVRAGAGPVWSPDGRSIAFMSASRCGGILVMRLGSARARTVVPRHCGPGGSGVLDDYAPGGTTLIYHRIDAFAATTAPTSDLFTVPVGGGKPRQITHTPRYSEEYARWSPDGSRLAWSRRARASNRPRVFGTFISTTSGKVLSCFHGSPLRVSWQPRRSR